MDDILALQHGVTLATAGEIAVKLAPEEKVRVTKNRPVNPEAIAGFQKAVEISGIHRDRHALDTIWVPRSIFPLHFSFTIAVNPEIPTDNSDLTDSGPLATLVCWPKRRSALVFQCEANHEKSNSSSLCLADYLVVQFPRVCPGKLPGGI
jgi:hypothetical protein